MLTQRRDNFGRAALNPTLLTRDFAPAAIETSRTATPAAAAISRHSAALASPSEGAARTRALTTA